MSLIDPVIQDFYTSSAEDTRLQTGLGPLEFLRNKQLIADHLPERAAWIADIGGGTGHYAAWLAGLGHQVILVDPVPKHVLLAGKRSKKSKRSFQCVLGEARRLPIADQTADLVILHGPLYHLQQQGDRIAALKEARRILRPGGIIIGFAITYAATTLAALQNGMIHHPDIYAMCKQELQSGEHEAPTAFPGMLAQAYFHKPAEFLAEFEAVGLRKIRMCAVEGIAWLDARFFQSWVVPEKQQCLLDLISLTDTDPELLCLSPHLMLAAEVDYDF